MDLPPLAASMYNAQWWAFVVHAADAGYGTGGWAYTLTDASSAAAQVAGTYAGLENYTPIGLSQLFSVARSISNSSVALNSAPDSSPVTDAMVAEAPWSRSAAEQAAMPVWQARTNVTYIDASGVQMEGTFTVSISQVLPASVGNLNTYIDLRIQDMLASPPGAGTPRSGQLVSIDRVTLLAV